MKKNRKNQKVLSGLSMLLSALLLIGIMAFFAGQECRAEGDGQTIPHGVSMDGIDLSGKTKEELVQIAQECMRELGEYPLEVISPNAEATILLKDLEIVWSNESDILASAFVESSKGSLINQYKAKKDLENTDLTLHLETRVNKDRLAAFLLANIDELNCEPKNATVERHTGNFRVIEGVSGMQVDLDATYEKIVASILKANSNRQDYESLRIEVIGTEQEPEIKADAFQDFGALLGEATTSYLTSDKGRTVNVTLATSKFNGTVLYPGEQLSALSIMNPVTSEGGYQKAATYTAGGVEDEIGGGICQVATTLYNAVLRAELSVDYRKPHSRIAGYVPYAADAMVYAAGNSDFLFSNNTDYPIYIESFVDNSKKMGTTTFRIYGVETRPANRTFEFETELLSYIIPDEDAEPSEYFTLIPDESLIPFDEARDENDIYAVAVSNFYPVVKAALYKNVYIDGVQTEHILVNTSTYKNRTGKYIPGAYRVHPDTYIKKLEYDVETKEMIITWWSHKWDEPEETTQEETEPVTTPETQPPTEASTEPEPSTETEAALDEIEDNE